jgi:hypothetical protein
MPYYKYASIQSSCVLRKQSQMPFKTQQCKQYKKRQENQFPKDIQSLLGCVIFKKPRTGDDFALDELIKRNEKYSIL